MTRWTRRDAARFAGVACLGLTAPRLTGATARARVVVIGGGIGGATVARYLSLADPALSVTLVEPKSFYTTCFFSNLYLAGLRSFESLTHRYDALAHKYGVAIVADMAVDIDPVAGSVTLKGGRKLGYDRLVVAPGIALNYGAIAGYDEAAAETLPHAWTAGAQTRLLRKQLVAMADGGTFIIVAPPDPFRCPPGPYERAALVAAYFKREKPKSKILILDAKDSFFEQDLFEDGWNRHYPGMIEWLPAQFTGGIKAVDVAGRAVKTAGDTYRGAVINVIPPQRAGEFASVAGVVDSTGWCPVDQNSFESTLHPRIHIVGDAASAGDMPKSAFATNSQAKVCAFAVAAALNGSDPPKSRPFNTCFTYLAPDDAVADAISFRHEASGIKIAEIAISPVGESAALRAAKVRQSEDWYRAFTRDVFG